MNFSKEIKECLNKLDNNPQMDQAWTDYRSKNVDTVGGYMETLPLFIKKWEKENGILSSNRA